MLRERAVAVPVAAVFCRPSCFTHSVALQIVPGSMLAAL